MTDQDLIKYKSRIIGNIKKQRLHDAFSELKQISAEINSWELIEEIRRAEDAYAMMIKYTIDGANDPSRVEVYNDIVTSVFTLLDRISREFQKRNQSPKIYYSTIRYADAQRLGPVSRLISRYEDECSRSSLYNFIADNTSKDDSNQTLLTKELLERDIFNKVWTSYPVSAEDFSAIENAIFSPVFPPYFQQLLLSALLLGLIEYYDESKLSLLLNVYQKGEEQLAVKALCAVMITLFLYRERVPSKKLRNQIDAVRELPQWHDDVKMIFLQLLRARDTERVSRKMQDEFLPEMMKLRPDIYKKLNDFSEINDVQSLDENPEWQEILDNSGLTEKMRELSELQQNGSDVFMSTFSHLKSYPFFSTVSNWFLPFHIDQSDVDSAIGAKNNILGNLIATSPFMCDSDKYSFALSMKSVPEQQREMMMTQLNAQNINVAELQNAELFASDKIRENIANKYLQDLYRFFKLHRSKKDFVDPFSMLLNIPEITILSDELQDVDTLMLVSEFYFKYKYYSEAYEVFKLLLEKMPPTAQLFQKMGYAMQRIGNIADALKYYEQSELLNADSVWTLRRIAACHKLLGNTSAAFGYYQRLADKLPEDITVSLNIGHCLLELGRYDEALKYYYKVEFLEENSTRALRPIAWCLLMQREYNQSRLYYEKLLAISPNEADYMNVGHLSLVAGDYHRAVKFYKESLTAMKGDADKFIQAFTDDAKYFDALGIKSDILPFIIDAVLYEYERN